MHALDSPTLCSIGKSGGPFMIVSCDNKDTHHGSNVVVAWFLYFVCYIFFYVKAWPKHFTRNLEH